MRSARTSAAAAPRSPPVGSRGATARKELGVSSDAVATARPGEGRRAGGLLFSRARVRERTGRSRVGAACGVDRREKCHPGPRAQAGPREHRARGVGAREPLPPLGGPPRPRERRARRRDRARPQPRDGLRAHGLRSRWLQGAHAGGRREGPVPARGRERLAPPARPAGDPGRGGRRLGPQPGASPQHRGPLRAHGRRRGRRPRRIDLPDADLRPAALRPPLPARGRGPRYRARRSPGRPAMRRREFVKGMGVAGSLAALEWSPLVAAAAEDAVAAPTDALGPESRKAFAELLALVAEAERRTLSAEWGVRSAQEVVDGHRLLLNLLSAASDLYFEADPERPHFVPIVSPIRKFLGDNPAAVYFLAPLRGDRAYRIHGNVGGAVYTSFTFQTGDENGVAGKIFATRNDREFGVGRDGSYAFLVAPDASGPGSVRLAPAAVSVTTRHYFENEISAQNDPTLRIPLAIEPLVDPGPPPPLDDATAAWRIRLAAGFVRQATLGIPPRDPKQQPAWVSTVPNQLGEPSGAGQGEGDKTAWGAVDNSYSMGPYLLQPDQALVIEGALPRCTFANVVLWNRWMMSYEYRSRQVSLNRRQMKLGEGGRYRIVLAARDPGVPNWLDTEGRPFGTIFWRFLEPEGKPERPRTRVVPVASLARG